MRYDSLTEAVRLLGCFSGTIDIPASQEPYTFDPESDVHSAFAELFAHSKEDKYEDDGQTHESGRQWKRHCCAWVDYLSCVILNCMKVTHDNPCNLF